MLTKFSNLLSKSAKNFKGTIQEFPTNFWIIVGGGFIDRLGGTMIFPFFALYITGKFGVEYTQAGILLGLWSVCSSVGSMFGGALTDKLGRKKMALFGIVLSALTSLLLGFVEEFYLLYPVVIVAGTLANIGSPARQAMVVDILPEDKRAEGFGILRVVGNLSWIIGPTIGGLVFTRSPLALFIADAISSLIMAAIIFLRIPETKPEGTKETEQESFAVTLLGYFKVLADKTYIAFLGASMLMLLVYLQLYNTLSVYLRDVHGMASNVYGSLMSLNAFAVVLFQFWVTRKVSKRAPLLMMAFGATLYMIGFTMYGFVAGYLLFLLAMIIITFGEMVVMPVGSAFVAKLAPEEMRGRYMAVFGLSWAIPSTFGPALAGIIIDNYDPNWVWYGGGIIAAVSVAGFLLLHLVTRERLAAAEAELPIEAEPAVGD